MRWPLNVLALIVAALLLAYCAHASDASAADVSLPTRAAFYYPWFPETWTVNSQHVFYHPKLGYYDSSSQSVADAHVAALDYGKLDVSIASWWGPGTHQESTRIPLLLNRTQALGSPLAWTIYHEGEGQGDPTVAQIQSDLANLSVYASHPSFARIGGKPVIFVYNADDVDCSVADRWAQAASAWYVVLKVFGGYASCLSQPDSWHQYGPAVARSSHPPHSFSISPGFWRADEPSSRLARDPARWTTDVEAMDSAPVNWRLVTTFNEWGEGTSVEAATEWDSASGQGSYLDALSGVGSPPPPPPPTDDPVIAAAGDIACGADTTGGSCRQMATSDLLLALNPDAVLALGDVQYELGQLSNFQAYFHPSWGRVKPIIRPAVGNHEYGTSNAQGYRDYFGYSTTSPLYYAYTLGRWRIYALNSNCSRESCTTQANWLRQDAAANPAACQLMYMHHPYVSSDTRNFDAVPALVPLYQAFYDIEGDLVLVGHSHFYERFARQNPQRQPDPRGWRQIVVGTGGRNVYGFGTIKSLSEVRNGSTFGVLKVVLHATSFDWQFLPIAGQSFTDAGSEGCVGAPPTSVKKLDRKVGGGRPV